MANEQEVIEVVDMLMNAFSRWKPRSMDGLIELWVRKFADVEASVLRKAADMHIDRSKWPPEIHEIVTLLEQAWYEVQDDKDTHVWMSLTMGTREWWDATMTADGRIPTAPGHWSRVDPDKVILLEATQ